METKIDSVRLEGIRNKCGFSNGLCLSSVGLSGGIGLWWNDNNVNVVSYSNNHIAVDVSNNGNNNVWRAIGVYGWPENENKHQTWLLMKNLRQQSPHPTIFFGDFSEILSAGEKCGGGSRRDRCMDNFRECLDSMGVCDLGYKGNIYTRQRGLS
uniref:Uncharacterized protein n=1 Tax=Chenopodium quinoa TaxID=63459 RepID=A0A803MVI3_CHEQI